MESSRSATFIHNIETFVKAGMLPKLIDPQLPPALMQQYSIPQLRLSDLEFSQTSDDPPRKIVNFSYEASKMTANSS
ncbi:hypothetical protein KL932_003426 [Ogataea haglerorum]|uniref:uncharacterized protein n=1 Tax=Ogataea haglerorum TaxID=1937702 RepID=UPI001C8AC3C4|nr:uncharacterized protein KL911_002788 [Ogataea haglerorum]KAG7694080.1 hypothetical protein KL915_003751 [Ogataea haglerorum]KAG7704657.1 hypothetical protein KL914_004048 [Ogataea haglerorum]KAG7704903.1 hypothetical protein KL950_004076 [Ogataea haglerorum]KAG7739332.1 hypothetical protein KL932_003426 [Ogataea haglerorum]KAG7753395.1 hypothetical protein KL911_002788 [Ogataea haglerorum]